MLSGESQATLSEKAEVSKVQSAEVILKRTTAPHQGAWLPMAS